MEGDVDQVRATWIEAEELAIGHVGEPGKRMPVVGLPVYERPCESAPGEAGLDVLIFVNVVVVVIGHELVMARGPINSEGGGDEERTGQKRPEAAGLSVHGKEFVKEWRNAKIFRGPGEVACYAMRHVSGDEGNSVAT